MTDDHTLFDGSFRGKRMFYCSCGNFFRALEASGDTTIEDIKQMHAAHKWAWKENEKRHDLDD